MTPSPIIPRPYRLSGSGTIQSLMWNPNTLRPQRAISASTAGSHQTWYASTSTPTRSGGWRSAIAAAWASVLTTDRSAANIGCSGSIASLTPCSAA